MAHQVAPKIVTYPVDAVRYHVHRKDGSPDSLRVEYWSGLRCVAKEWVCLQHAGFARAKAEGWWARRIGAFAPGTVAEAVAQADTLLTPATVIVNESGKWPEIIRMEWEHEPDRLARCA
jgi:DNA repair protein RadD